MNSEERQAAIDALKDILQSRKEDDVPPRGAGPATDGGKLKIDPNLIYPAPKFPGKDSEDLNINDPKDLLSKLKQNKPKNNTKNQGGDTGSGMTGDKHGSDNKNDNSDDGKEKAKNTTKNNSTNNANDDYADA